MAKASIKKATATTAEAANTIETPTAAVVSASVTTATKIDKRGRTIKVQKITALQRLKMMEFLGALANNTGYMSIAGVAIMVREIDGDAVAMPRTKLELEALVTRLEEDGLDAAGEAVAEIMGLSVDDDGNLLQNGEVIVNAKNLRSTAGSETGSI